jgi:hypothetical protein
LLLRVAERQPVSWLDLLIPPPSRDPAAPGAWRGRPAGRGGHHRGRRSQRPPCRVRCQLAQHGRRGVWCSSARGRGPGSWGSGQAERARCPSPLASWWGKRGRFEARGESGSWRFPARGPGAGPRGVLRRAGGPVGGANGRGTKVAFANNTGGQARPGPDIYMVDRVIYRPAGVGSPSGARWEVGTCIWMDGWMCACVDIYILDLPPSLSPPPGRSRDLPGHPGHGPRGEGPGGGGTSGGEASREGGKK